MSRIKSLIFMLICSTTLVFGTVLADPPGGFGGKGNGMGKGGFTGGGSLPASHPPGLKSMPHGLAKKNKIPHGWTMGRKQGCVCKEGSSVCHSKTPKGRIVCGVGNLPSC